MLKRTFKKAFAADIVRTAVPPAPQEPAQMLEQRARQAWAERDRPGFIAAARALAADGRLEPASAVRLARALLDAGLAAEALALLLGPACEAAEAALRAVLLAETRLRLGCHAEARMALQPALAEGAAAPLAGEAGQLAAIIAALTGETSLQDWAAARPLIQAALELGLGAAAADLLRGFLAARGEAAPGEPDAVLEAAVAAFRLAGADAARALLQAMQPMFEAEGDAAAWRAALAVLGGETDEPAAAAPQGPRRLQLAACLGGACAAGERWRAAGVRLEPTRKRSDATSEALTELARCVGRDLLSGFRLQFAPPGPRKVFNLFPFNGEFTLLELRLEEMAPFVDRFVIVEAAETHTGRPKPMRFLERQGEFARYADKIVHVPVERFPPHIASAWARDFFQRDNAVRGLSGLCAPDDVVIISDADEIIGPDALARLPEGPLVGADLRTFGYFFNYEIVYGRPRIKAAFARAALLAEHGCSWLRVGAPRYFGHTYVPRAGWHFTSIADAAGLERKFQSSSHEEHGHLDRSHFEAVLARIRRDGLGPDYVRRELDEGFPAALRRRQAALASLLL